MNVLIIGASGGIGGALAAHYREPGNAERLLTASRTPPVPTASHESAHAVDLTEEASLAALAETVREEGLTLDRVVVATGLLHDGDALRPEKTMRQLDPAQLARAFAVNATGPALAAKHLLPLLPKDRRSHFAALSARVGSIGDNRLGGWYGYRASKAALNMLLKSLAIELARRNREAVCVGLHPGTVDTALSEPFQRGVPEHKLFTPAFAAERLLSVLDGLTPADSGGVFAWDGTPVPP